MALIIGLDIGGTTTKIVGFEEGNLFGFVRVVASDAFTSASGGLGKFLNVTGKRLQDVEKIHATGVGASQLSEDLFDCPTQIMPEFDCVGLGGSICRGWIEPSLSAWGRAPRSLQPEAGKWHM